MRTLHILAITLGSTLAACTTVPENLPFEVQSVSASVETDIMPGTGDRADDPAIWVNSANPEASLILGTDKSNGLYVYAMDGSTKQFLDVGAVNNVDLRDTLGVASNDEVGALSWFAIDADSAEVSHLGDTPVDMVEPYGACLGMIAGKPVAGVTYKDGTVQLWTATISEDGSVSSGLDRTLKLPTQLEGCVFDDQHQRLFIGEEAAGIWVLDLSDPAPEPAIVDTIAAGNGLVADVEGLSLWKAEDGSGYLVASAQEADRYVVYDRLPPHAPRGIFSIVESTDGTIDAVSHTDGLDVVSAALPGYPRGLLVVQDDTNGGLSRGQNFKLVDWATIETALGLTE
jgi:3-phytase